MKKHMIYDSNWINQDEDSDYDIYFDDEVDNLNKELDNKILVIAELHLWDGIRSGFKIIDSQNLNAIMYVGQGERKKVYMKGRDIIMEDSHHDGTNIYTFRLIKDIDKIHNLTDKIYNNDFSSKDISRYTKSLGNIVRKIYGW
jgi:hypothetical protein